MRLIIMAALALAACDQIAAPKQDRNICTTPPKFSAAVGDWRGCVARWAYRLAPARDGTAIVAKAAVAGCQDTIEAAANRALIEAKGTPDLRYIFKQEAQKGAEDLALFSVVQARAGHCDVPE